MTKEDTNPMKLEQLRQIIAIEQHKSISKAAKALYMGQPALSTSVNNLEKEIGVQIYYRNSQGVVPTEDGKKILEIAHRMVNDSNVIMSYANQNDFEHITGKIKVSLAPAYSYLFFDIITRYKERFPKVDFRLGIYPLVRMKELIRNGEYCAAIDFVPVKTIEEEKFSVIQLKNHKVQLFAGPLSKFYDRNSVDIEEVREEKFVAFSREYWVQNNRNLKLKKNPIFIEDNASIREILRRSDMIAVMPDMYNKLEAVDYEGRPRMIPLTGIDQKGIHGSLVYPGNRQLTLLEQYTIEFLKDLMMELE